MSTENKTENKTETKVVKKKVTGNKTTELIIGTAASKLTTGIVALQATVEAIGQLEEKAKQNTLVLLEQEDKMGALEQELSNKKAQNKYEIELAYKTDKKAFVDEWLSVNKMSAVTDAEWLEMQEKLSKSDSNLEAAVKKEVAIVTSSLKAEHTSALKVMQLEHEKKEAANTAEINQLKLQNQFLTDQMNHWKSMLEKQMQAETERAKHQPAIHVNGTNTGR